MSRSIERRVAIMKGQPAPDFSEQPATKRGQPTALVVGSAGTDCPSCGGELDNDGICVDCGGGPFN